ncbi:hypothetical protein [Streptomyces gibsoniae]|uniref:Uncharacterized protein n=1 Tax=Streptomyces gibsoniae TaxID=3075529 RepID=A0ABU2UAE4_9ACTN|nr:hypothetical protein [Streptomyces sp. DSM 41699]MDT0470192.1 hypothetical protein [Streptomyces sp. DSM 41699]
MAAIEADQEPLGRWNCGTCPAVLELDASDFLVIGKVVRDEDVRVNVEHVRGLTTVK